MIFSNKKSFLLATVFFVSMASDVFAQPRAAIAEPAKDLGIFHQDELINYDFIIKNEGNATLQITDVRAECGCVATNYDKTIGPGQTGKVHAKVNISSFNGVISKDIYIFTNDSTNPEITVTIKGKVIEWITPIPGYARVNH